MKAKRTILFLDPLGADGQQIEGGVAKPSSPNLGLLYLSSSIKRRYPIRTVLLDLRAAPLSSAALAKKIADIAPDCVAISAKTFHVLGAFEAARASKSVLPHVPVILGGAHASALPKESLIECPEIDACVRGEGESTMVDIAQRVASGADGHLFSGINGCFHRRGDEIIEEPARDLIKDLDGLPLPDYDIVDLTRYAREPSPNGFSYQHVFPVFASRGCPFNCTFCMPLLTRKYRSRSVESVIGEIKYLSTYLGARRVYFEDSLFAAKPGWLAEFCEEYRQSGLHRRVRWGFETRIDVADAESFRLARRAGCIYVNFGVESGDSEILRKANKRYTREEIFEKTRLAKQAGIQQVNMSLILGLPYETTTTANNTLSILRDADYDTALINVLSLYPGTEVFEMADRGIGGLRWREGMRMNWASYSRYAPQAEVNDLGADKLLALRDRGQEILRIRSQQKARWHPVSHNMKRAGFFYEMLRNDRPRLAHYLVDNLRRRINRISGSA